MSKLISAVIAAGLGLGLNAATAQNVDSDKPKAQGQEQIMQNKEQSADSMRTYDQTGERQVGLEQYRLEQQQCATMSAESRRDCMQKAKVRYQGWAIMQCELVSGASRQKCYQNIQAAVMGRPSGPVVRNPGATDNGAPDTGQAVERGEDEQKPGRQ